MRSGRWCLLSLAAVLQHWGACSTEDSSSKRNETHNHSETHEPKKTQESHVSSLDSFTSFSSSFQDETSVFLSSPSFSIFSSLDSSFTQTPSLQIADINSSHHHSSTIKELDIKETVASYGSPTSSPVAFSSYLLEDSFIENSHYLFENILESSSSVKYDEDPYISPSESVVLESTMFGAEEIHSQTETYHLDLDTLLPYAESRIHFLSPTLSTSPLMLSSEVIEVPFDESSPEDLDFPTTPTLQMVPKSTELSSELIELTPSVQSIVASVAEDSPLTAGSSEVEEVTTDSSFELLSDPTTQGNISHEIISDVPKNKSSRQEDPQLGNIISGIVHLLAGNVQLAALPRPPLPSPPRRPAAFPSTRINNRGPITSRTVVVFSQPPAATETQYVPSNHPPLHRPPDRGRVPPTKWGEKPAVRYPPQRPNRPPFLGDRNRAPSVPKIQASIPNHLQTLKPETSFPHFIFSDGSGSSVKVVLSSLPPKAPPSRTLPPPIQTNNVIPTKTSYEVLADTRNQPKPIRNENLSLENTLKPSLSSEIKENSIKATSIQKPVPTDENQAVPFGPITDWVAVFERPSMKFKPYPNKTRTDNDVSIIMQPIIFDVTVSNSMNKITPSKTEISESTSSSSFSVLPTDIVQPSTLENTLSSAFPTPKLEILESTSFSTHSKPKLPYTSSVVKISDSAEYNPQPKSSFHHLTPSSESTTSTTSTTSNSRVSAIRITSETSSLRGTAIRPLTSSSINSFKSNLPETPTTTTRIYPKTSPVSLPSSRTFGTYSHSHPPLGRPIVIPVDIEEVRPFVGAINPVNQDRPRGAFPSIPAPVPPMNTKDSLSPLHPSRTPIIRSPPRSRPNTIRIDTCIVGDDSTCDVKVNETCKTENGISSCHCRPGYSRSYTRGPCIPVVSLMLSIKIDRLENKRINFSPKYLDKNSEEYRIMEFEAKQALTSLFSQTAFSRSFLGMNVNTFYSVGGKLTLNSTVHLEEKESTRAQSVRLRLRQEVGEAIKKRNQNIGDSRLYVEGPLSPLTNVEDVNECSDPNLNDCASDGTCLNVFGTFLCKCRSGYVDPYLHDERKSGRKCLACSPEYCSYHGQCFVEREQKLCKCLGNYIGSRCEIDGEVLGVALGVSLAAIIIILLTLSCLCIWNRKWKKQQQKAEVLSARSYNSNQTFSYLSNMLNANANNYQLTMEDRMRWSHISDVVKSASMTNQDSGYVGTLEPASYPTRYQHPSDEEASWYDYRTRPRSRMLPHPGASPNATYYEMDSPSRGPYMSSSCHSTKRFKNPNAMMRY